VRDTFALGEIRHDSLRLRRRTRILLMTMNNLVVVAQFNPNKPVDTDIVRDEKSKILKGLFYVKTRSFIF